MSKRNILSAPGLNAQQQLSSLVENKTSYNLRECEFAIYETHRAAYDVGLAFNDFAFTSMLRGKKVMKIKGQDDKFEYLPGESVLVAAGEEMIIDFPDADTDAAQCIALSISKEFIGNTIDYLNGRLPKENGDGEWKISASNFYMFNSPALASATNNIMRIAMEDNTAKDLMAELALKELLIRLMQTQARNLLDSDSEVNKNTRFGAVVDFIKSNLQNKISMEKLSEKAYMSKSNFFKSFKREFGITPNSYILKERISKAKRLLKQQISLAETAYSSGFSDLNYFIKTFKEEEGITPKKFQLAAIPS